MENQSTNVFWNIQASDIIPLLIGAAIIGLAYGLIRGARNYLHIQIQYTAIVLISGVLAILVYLGSVGKISEDGLIGILGSLIGYVLGSLRQIGSGNGTGGDDKK